jgi:predicted RNA-binding Zn ribbon-like protein
VDHVRGAEQAVALLNATLSDVAALQAVVSHRPRLQARCTDRDCVVLRRFQRELRPVVAAFVEARVDTGVRGLNELFLRYPMAPRLSAHEPRGRHIHVGSATDPVAHVVMGEALLGLGGLLSAQGPGRLGACASSACSNYYVDASPNRSRVFCSSRCSSRENVAAYRARHGHSRR